MKNNRWFVQQSIIFRRGLILCVVFFIILAAACAANSLRICATGFAVRDMVEDEAGNLWIATFGNGLWRKNADKIEIFSTPAANDPFPMISNLLLEKNRLWIATTGGGCVCLNLQSKELEPIKQAPGFEKLHGLIKTSHGAMLIGSVGSGTAILRHFNKKPAWEAISPRNLQHLSWVNDFYEWQQQLWLATNIGLYSTAAAEVDRSWSPRSAGLGEGANCLKAYDGLLYIGTTTRGVFAMKPGKQPYPLRNTYGEIYFITRFAGKLLAGGQYGLWELDEKAGREIARFPDIAAKSHLVTNNNTLLIGTMDGRIIKTEDLNEFTLLLNLQQHGAEEPDNAD